MFTSSGDILNLVLAVSIAVLTFFLCWAIYYFVASVQKVYNLVKRIELGIEKAEELLEIAKGKLKNSSAYFMILGEIVRKAMDFVKEKKEKKQTTKKK